ncbi:Sec8 exocyst complex component-specific domain-domain-containing protein [Clohesyomyces aquaticus]|uniref:Exocyst complex component Sec8 n=1 Tax=Clohesyomyces aquaticus TaxID=1231657 RepID=A0A1Y2A562_9PLEO|nr:Sec8 exocyst complex component-specific domain-domain-containing protein [Clohesyomyces aquaticus]
MSRLPNGRRPGANGAGGYTNGYSGNGGYGGLGDVEDDYGSQRRPSNEGRYDRRPGGYGGFSPAEPEDDDGSHVHRPTSLERTRATQRRSRDGSYGSGSSRSGERRGPGAGRFGAGSHEMEEILRYIRQDWDFMTNEKCVPVQISLKLMDPSSLGLANQYAQFRQTHQELQRALKAIVNEHHQGFNSSIGTFHKIQRSIQDSQHRVRSLKDSLIQAKAHLSTTKPELKEYATTSQKYDEMIQVLNTIGQLQIVPDKLEARISEKRFLSAVDILQDALRMIRKSEMENIGALSDLRIYLSNQEHSLTDILIEELHNHLYLKSPYCEDRWKQYAQNQAKGDLSERAQTDVRGRLLYHFLDKLDTSEPMTDDSPRNPEADTFQYMQLVIESLNRMNRLEIAVDTIEQRLPVELFKVVEKSNTEVAQRHPGILRAYATHKGGKSDTGVDSEDLRAGLLNDLLWTLYARFEAIAESHRVIHDVVAGIVRREGIRDSSSAALTRGFKELWKLYQSEMRSLLHDYLATDGDLLYRGGEGKAANTSAFSRAPRDRNKRMFKLADMDTKSSDLTTEREDLEFILKSSVPGLVSDAKRPDDPSENNNANLDGSATGHKLLVEPSVFNMGILLPPSLDFLNRLKEVVPPGSDIVMSTLTSFLDDFLVNVFHPQLDETLIELCAQTFIEIDAFQQEPQWDKHSKKPIFKGTAKFFTLITAFCKMLDNLPHDQAFSQLIITQMQTYYDKCCGWYKALVSRSQPKASGRRIKASAAFAESGELSEVISSLYQAEPDKVPELLEKEVALLMKEVEDDSLDEPDLIRDKKSITNLCLLYTSMKWLATKVAKLRLISDRATDSSNAEPGHPKHNRRWTLLTSTEPRTEGVPVYLPLNKETAAAFDNVVSSYLSLSTLIIRTLHFSLRTTIIYMLNSTLQTTYTLDTEHTEPSPGIISLNSLLVNIDSEIQIYIPVPQLPCITAHIAPLMDTYLLFLCRRITSMNDHGCKLMQLNILVLQQNLKNISPSSSAALSSTSDLKYSALFFDLFTLGPDAVVARAKEFGKGFGVPGDRFGYKAVKGLLELCYSERLVSERREVGVAARRKLDEGLLEVSEAMY